MSMSVAPPSAFLIVDLAGFTALTEAHGDEAAADIAWEFFQEVRGRLPEHGGEELNAMGDALLLGVRDPGRAVCLAVCVVRELGLRHGALGVRAGMHVGSAVRRGDHWFGAVINITARAADVAAAGEVVLTADVARMAARELEHRDVRDLGQRPLRNLAAPVRLYALVLSCERTDDGLPVDPVCRMAVAPGKGLTHVHADVVYRFCSRSCLQRYTADPETYLPTPRSKSGTERGVIRGA
jgi:adenylate cyclase